MVSILGNLAQGHRLVQDEILSLGGVELILSQCQLDPSSPFVREWGLWAMRNLCCGNVAVQERITNLDVKTSVVNEALAAQQQQVELDKNTGRWKLTAASPGAEHVDHLRGMSADM